MVHQYLTNRRGLNIHIEEHLFDGDDVFLLCHGFTGSILSHVIATVRTYLRDKQISSVSIDFTNNINDSEGDFLHNSVTGEVEDLEVIYERVLQRYKRVFVLGHSMGCTVSLEFALRKEVSGLILVAPPYSMKEIIDQVARAHHVGDRDALEKWREEGTYPVYKERNQKYYPLSYEFYEDLSNLDPKRYRLIHVPSVIIYSLADPLIPARDSERLFEELGSEKKRLIAVENAPHSFNNSESTTLFIEKFEESLAFFKKE